MSRNWYYKFKNRPKSKTRVIGKKQIEEFFNMWKCITMGKWLIQHWDIWSALEYEQKTDTTLLTVH